MVFLSLNGLLGEERNSRARKKRSTEIMQYPMSFLKLSLYQSRVFLYGDEVGWGEELVQACHFLFTLSFKFDLIDLKNSHFRNYLRRPLGSSTVRSHLDQFVTLQNCMNVFKCSVNLFCRLFFRNQIQVIPSYG